LAWLLPALLLLVAAVQVTAVLVAGLTPWKGGGFGMFSTVDRLDYRVLRVVADTAAGPVPLNVANAVSLGDGDLPRRQHTAAVAWPSTQRLLLVADAAAALSWQQTGSAPAVANDWEGQLLLVEGQPVPVDTLRVEVWSMTFPDQRPRQLVPVKIASVERVVRSS